METVKTRHLTIGIAGLVMVLARFAPCAELAFPRMPGFVRTARTEEATEMKFEDWVRDSYLKLDGLRYDENTAQAILKMCKVGRQYRDFVVEFVQRMAKLKNVKLFPFE